MKNVNYNLTSIKIDNTDGAQSVSEQYTDWGHIRGEHHNQCFPT
jgi:hypothetical protein